MATVIHRNVPNRWKNIKWTYPGRRPYQMAPPAMKSCTYNPDTKNQCGTIECPPYKAKRKTNRLRCTNKWTDACVQKWTDGPRLGHLIATFFVCMWHSCLGQTDNKQEPDRVSVRRAIERPRQSLPRWSNLTTAQMIEEAYISMRLEYA